MTESRTTGNGSAMRAARRARLGRATADAQAARDFEASGQHPRAALAKRRAKLARLADAGVLDAEWYLACNHDVSAAALDPIGHYLLNGVLEGREPRDIAPLISEIRAEEGTRSSAAGATSH